MYEKKKNPIQKYTWIHNLCLWCFQEKFYDILWNKEKETLKSN